MHEITPHRFENVVRHKLRFGHGMEHKDLQRVSDMFHETLKKLGSNSLHKDNYHEALKEFREHENWKLLSPNQQAAVMSAFDTHLKITPE